MGWDGRIEVRNMDAIGRNMTRRVLMAEDLKWINSEFEEYMQTTRKNAQWSNQGLIPGPYGGGSKKWAKNAKATIKDKGFNKPLFSENTNIGSSIYREGFFFRVWHQAIRGTNASRAKFRYWAERYRGDVNYAAVNDRGSDTIPARRHQGFIDGDLKWLLKRGVHGLIAIQPGGKNAAKYMNVGGRKLTWSQLRGVFAQAGQTGRAGAEFVTAGRAEEIGQPY
jgi:hypothetical protein